MTTNQNHDQNHDTDPSDLPQALIIDVRDDGDAWTATARFNGYTDDLQATLLVGVATAISRHASLSLEDGQTMDEVVQDTATTLAVVHSRLLRTVLEALPTDVRDAFLAEAMRHATGDDDE